MHTTSIFTGVLSCLLLLFTLTHSYMISNKNMEDALVAHSSNILPHKYISIYEDNGLNLDNSDEHELEKRRFNAWAGKRSVLAKRRFNAWAGRR